jgi:hypothetical protein
VAYYYLNIFFYLLQFSGVAQEGSSTRHLLPGVAMAGPPVSPRAEGGTVLQLSLQREAEGRLHQSVPLRPGGVAGFAAGVGAEVLRSVSRSDDAVSASPGK